MLFKLHMKMVGFSEEKPITMEKWREGSCHDMSRLCSCMHCRIIYVQYHKGTCNYAGWDSSSDSWLRDQWGQLHRIVG